MKTASLEDHLKEVNASKDSLDDDREKAATQLRQVEHEKLLLAKQLQKVL